MHSPAMSVQIGINGRNLKHIIVQTGRPVPSPRNRVTDRRKHSAPAPDGRVMTGATTAAGRPADASDAIVVGAGINGMCAAALLAREGWSVTLLDAAPDIGGFIGSAELTRPGYVHDTWSSWHPLFLTGAAYAQLGPDL